MFCLRLAVCVSVFVVSVSCKPAGPELKCDNIIECAAKDVRKHVVDDQDMHPSFMETGAKESGVWSYDSIIDDNHFESWDGKWAHVFPGPKWWGWTTYTRPQIPLESIFYMLPEDANESGDGGRRAIGVYREEGKRLIELSSGEIDGVINDLRKIQQERYGTSNIPAQPMSAVDIDFNIEQAMAQTTEASSRIAIPTTSAIRPAIASSQALPPAPLIPPSPRPKLVQFSLLPTGLFFKIDCSWHKVSLIDRPYRRLIPFLWIDGRTSMMYIQTEQEVYGDIHAALRPLADEGVVQDIFTRLNLQDKLLNQLHDKVSPPYRQLPEYKKKEVIRDLPKAPISYLGDPFVFDKSICRWTRPSQSAPGTSVVLDLVVWQDFSVLSSGISANLMYYETVDDDGGEVELRELTLAYFRGILKQAYIDGAMYQLDS
jgi:hypothetical protein